MPRRLGGALAALAALLAVLPVPHGHGHAPGAVSDGHLTAYHEARWLAR